MTIPATPLPRFGDVVRAALSPLSNGEAWAAQTSEIFFFERGAMALAGAIEAIRARDPNQPITVWLPDLICDEPLDWIRALGFNISYYPVTERLETRWDDICRRVSVAGVHVVVIVHYFGFPNLDVVRASELAKRTNIVPVEDAAHVLAPCRGIGGASYVVYSPRKLLSIPSVGCLVVNGRSAMLPEPRDGHTGSADWFMRRFAQRIMRAVNLDWHGHWARQAGEVPRCRRRIDGQWRRASRFARRMLTIEEKRLSGVRDLRRSNYLRLAECVEQSDFFVSLFSRLPEGICPYVFPVRVPMQVERIVREFKSAGIPASRWPDLPVEVLNDPGAHEEAIALTNSLMLLPVHQGLSSSDVDAICVRLLRVSAEMMEGR